MNPFPQPIWTEVSYTDGKGNIHTLPSEAAMIALMQSCTSKYPRYSWNESQNRVEEVYKLDTSNYEDAVRVWFKELGIIFTDDSSSVDERPWLRVETPGGVFNIEDLVAP